MHTDGSAPAQPIPHRVPVPPWMAALAWGILAFLGFIATITALVWPMGQLQEATDWPHSLILGVWALTWVLGSGLVTLAAARVVFKRWLEVRPAAWLLLSVGAALTATQATILAEWTIGRFGISEPELAGPMALLFAAIAGGAVAGFGVQVAPRSARWAPLIAAEVGVVVTISIIATNLPGLADGIGRDSWPLAGATIAATLYIGAVAILSLARLRHA